MCIRDRATCHLDPAPVVACAKGQLGAVQPALLHQPDRAAKAVKAGDRHLGHHQRVVAYAGQDAYFGLFAKEHRFGAAGTGQPDAALFVNAVTFQPDPPDGAVELFRWLSPQAAHTLSLILI